MIRKLLAVVAALSGVATTAVAVSAQGAVERRHPGELIVFGESTCAPNWYAPNKGRTHFRVHNRSHHRATVYLVRMPSGRIVGQVKHSEPGTTRRLSVHLHPGTYLWGCYLDGEPAHVSDTEQVPIDDNHGGPGTPIIPISRTDIRGPFTDYRRGVGTLVTTLQGQVGDLVSDLSSGDVDGAEQSWVAAHLTWLRIGQDNSAYGAFGELGRRIDGTSAGLVDGTADPGFTGFHKVELDLWDTQDPVAALADATQLRSLVDRIGAGPLTRWLPTNVAAERDWILRVHEILEDALRDTVSGHDDYGSGTGLASLIADSAATRVNLDLLAPLVRPRSPHLVSRARHHLDRLVKVVRGTRADGAWVPIDDLPRAERERVNAAVGDAVETLASVASLLQIGGKS